MSQDMSIGEVARFFDQNTSWIRWRERQGFFTEEDGTPIEFARKSNSKLGGKGDRRYSLNDARKMAHSLRRHDIIDNRQLEVIIERIESFEEKV